MPSLVLGTNIWDAQSRTNRVPDFHPEQELAPWNSQAPLPIAIKHEEEEEAIVCQCVHVIIKCGFAVVLAVLSGSDEFPTSSLPHYFPAVKRLQMQFALSHHGSRCLCMTLAKSILIN